MGPEKTLSQLVLGLGFATILLRSLEQGIGQMWRSLFLAAGIVLCILGAECLIVEKAVLAGESTEGLPKTSFFAAATPPPANEIKPPDWAPWSLLSSGAVVIIYSYSIPRRNG
jgi:hypothetical protein